VESFKRESLVLTKQSGDIGIGLTVNQDQIKAFLREANSRAGEIGTGLNLNAEFFENPAQHLSCRLVNAHQQGR